jgi:ABC-type uncharacterized transport system involved in gliding motility auxiliary subunit
MRGWAALVWGLGAVAIGFGLLSALLALFQPVTDLSLVWANLVVGLILVGVAAIASFDALRERARSGEGRRASRYATGALLRTALAVSIVCLLAFLSARHAVRFDWSQQRVNTLSQQSLQVLAELEHELRITAFFDADAAPLVRDLLRRYEYQSDRVRLEFVDPNRRPDRVAALEVDEQILARGLVRITSGEEKLDVTEFTESSVTNALVKLTRDGHKKVYFLEGHNERLVSGQGVAGAAGVETAEGKEGYSRIAAALRNETYLVEPLLLASRGEVPEDAAALVIAGPTRPLFDQEHQALRRYLERGGALAVLIDPRAQTDLFDDLRSFGVALSDDVVVDQAQSLFGRATSPFAASYAPRHPITEGLRESALFHMARSVVTLSEAETDFETLVYTGDNSWAERDLEGWVRRGSVSFDDGDLAGPVPLAVAGTPRLDPPSAEARLVVFGDSNFASNEFVDTFRNKDLFLNAINWLIGDEEHIAVRPNLARSSSVELSNQQFQQVVFLSLFALPEGIAVVGVVAWWMRRKRPGR